MLEENDFICKTGSDAEDKKILKYKQLDNGTKNVPLVTPFFEVY